MLFQYIMFYMSTIATRTSLAQNDMAAEFANIDI